MKNCFYLTFVIRTKQSNVFNRYVPKNKKHDKKWIRMILGHVSNLRLCAYIANIIFGRWVMGLFWSEPAWSSCSSLAFFASGALIFSLSEFFSNRNFRPSIDRKSTLSPHFRHIDFDESCIQWIIRWVICWRELD